MIDTYWNILRLRLHRRLKPLIYEKTMQSQLSHQERIAWIRLIRSENVGIKTFYTLLQTYGSALKALSALPDMAKRGGSKKAIRIYSEIAAEKEIEETEYYGAKMVLSCEPSYPPRLQHIISKPPVLTMLGDPMLCHQDVIAMVGARNASLNGCRFATNLAADIGKSGAAVISGLARGIDTAAHQGSVETGTIAVIAGGIDHIYPRENTDLYKRIAEQGVVIAELPFGTSPRAQHFPQRNRIISGIALGTVVVEATIGSGSLITARMALEQNREVFAVPGFPLDPRCKGTNKLIKEGATLIENVQDILDAFPAFPKHQEEALSSKPQKELALDDVDHARSDILKLLSATPLEVDALIEQSGLPTQMVQANLLELELAGKLKRHQGNKVSLAWE